MREEKRGEERRVMDIGEVRGGGKCKVIISLFFSIYTMRMLKVEKCMHRIII
jgi:hypothetical protein